MVAVAIGYSYPACSMEELFMDAFEFVKSEVYELRSPK